MQIREEVAFTKGRIIVRGKLVTRGKAKRADYILYYKPNIPIAIIEAKDNNHSVGDGMQQALDYAVTLNIPFVFSSNGDGFVFHDRTGTSVEKEATLSLDAFPTPKDLWSKYRAWKGLSPDEEAIVLQDYFEDGSGKGPRYYQTNAINAAIEAIAKGQNRILLVMATGTGKTYTAFQIIWRLWKAGRKKRILCGPQLQGFLARRTTSEVEQEELSCDQSGTPSRLSDQQVTKGQFMSCERFPAPLIKQVQLLKVRLQQVRRHFRLLKGIVDSNGLNLVEQYEPELLHGNRVHVQCLLQELESRKAEAGFCEPGSHVLRRDPMVWLWIYADSHAHYTQVGIFLAKRFHCIRNRI